MTTRPELLKYALDIVLNRTTRLYNREQIEMAQWTANQLLSDNAKLAASYLRNGTAHHSLCFGFAAGIEELCEHNLAARVVMAGQGGYFALTIVGLEVLNARLDDDSNIVTREMAVAAQSPDNGYRTFDPDKDAGTDRAFGPAVTKTLNDELAKKRGAGYPR